jgi:hypothetical protein
VDIGCSIDGIGPVAAYLRPPVEWSVIERNVEKVAAAQGNMRATFSVTLSVFNVLHFLDMLRYMVEKNYQNFDILPHAHELVHPPYYSVKILPPHAKDLVRKKYLDF